jgi:hypothetical protein
MSTGAEAIVIGELSNNGMIYHLPNPVMTNENINYTITCQRVYPHQGHFGRRYPNAMMIANIGEDVDDTDFGANGRRQLFMENVVWAGVIGVAKMVLSEEFSQFNTILRDLLHHGLEDCNVSERKPEGEIHSM